MRDIFLDFDLPFEEWIRSIRFNHVIRKLKRQFEDIDFIRVRESSSGHVHVWVRYRQDLDTLEHFVIRAALWDDPDRIINDLRRLYYNGSESKINRCFDAKVRAGSVSRAGDWIEYKVFGVA